jgi:thiopeptide-type bacteriocin biosynthesis protein
MPADHMSVAASRVAASVEAVLAGAALTTAAAEIGVDPVHVADAVQTYRAAGLAALQRRHEAAWYHALVALPDGADAEATVAAQIAPHLDQIGDGQPFWWFLRKHPYWRLRVHTADHHAIGTHLDALAAAGTVDHWRSGVYEPEAAAFGGDTAMEIIHDLFCVDSQGVLAYARQHAPQLGRRELSLLLIRALHQHAGLDWFEAGDVFDRVAQTRPTPADADATRVEALATRMRPLLAVPVQPETPMFAPGGPVGYAAPWLAGFIRAGQRLGDLATAGRLDRGLRAVLAHIVIFHWNRLGLPAQTQGILAHAAKAAILPRS